MCEPKLMNTYWYIATLEGNWEVTYTGMSLMQKCMKVYYLNTVRYVSN